MPLVERTDNDDVFACISSVDLLDTDEEYVPESSEQLDPRAESDSLTRATSSAAIDSPSHSMLLSDTVESPTDPRNRCTNQSTKSVSKTRKYICKVRKKGSSSTPNVMPKRREVSVEKRFQSDVSKQKCCKRHNFFAKANIRYLDAQAKWVSTMLTKQRRSYLESML